MTLGEDRCWALLAAARHGVLATVHARRGVDAVPVVFATVDASQRRVIIPVDTVKPKGSRRLQRLANLDADARCVLLVDHYDDDWSALWWVRVHGRAVASQPSADARAQLAVRYPQYRPPDSVVAVVTLEPTAISGWSAQDF